MDPNSTGPIPVPMQVVYRTPPAPPTPPGVRIMSKLIALLPSKANLAHFVVEMILGALLIISLGQPFASAQTSVPPVGSPIVPGQSQSQSPAPSQEPQLPIGSPTQLGPDNEHTCGPANSFANPQGLDQLVSYYRSGVDSAMVQRDLAWLNANSAYYGFDGSTADDLADWFETNVVLIKTSDDITVQNTYCTPDAVHTWRTEQQQAGTWTFYLKGDSGKPFKPVRKAVCLNWLILVAPKQQALPTVNSEARTVTVYVPVTQPNVPTTPNTPQVPNRPVPPSSPTPPKTPVPPKTPCPPKTPPKTTTPPVPPTTTTPPKEQPPTTTPPKEQPPKEQPPTEQPPTEQPPTEQPPTEQPPKEEKPASSEDDMLNGKGPFHKEMKQDVQDNTTSGVDTGKTEHAPKHEPTSSPSVDTHDSHDSGKSSSDSGNDDTPSKPYVGSTSDDAGHTVSNDNTNTHVGSDDDVSDSHNTGATQVSAFDEN